LLLLKLHPDSTYWEETLEYSAWTVKRIEFRVSYRLRENRVNNTGQFWI